MAKMPKDVDKQVGARIRLRRKLLGISQDKLADSIGLTFQQVQKYENGTNRVGASRLVEIGAALQVEPGWFFEGISSGGSSADEGQEVVRKFMSDPYGARIMVAVGRLDDETKRSLVNMLERMAGI